MRLMLFITTILFTTLSFSSYSQEEIKTGRVPGEILIQIISGASVNDLSLKAPAQYELKIERLLSKPMNIWLLEFDDSTPGEVVMNWLLSQPEVLESQFNHYVNMRSTLPGDPNVDAQWHHNNTGQGGGTVDADIDSDLAWDITQGGTTASGHDIVVCMVEGSGGNLDHQDLAPNRWINNFEIPDNGIDDDGNGYIDDYYGWNTGQNNDNTGTGSHGTNCLGMIGAKGDNGLNIVGANWDVKLMVLNMGGSLTDANVVEAYTYPLVQRQLWNNSGGAQGAFVVATSASWGIDAENPNSHPLWCNFYDTLGYYGIINVGATTNSNLDVDVVGDMPTACNSEYMVGVGRTDKNDGTAGGYGDQTINFGAPGISVVTTNGTNGITATTGTSFACPLTAGVIGLAYSIPCNDFMEIVMADPQGAADLVLYALNNGVDVKPALQNKFIYGGRLNSRNTLDTLIAMTCNINNCGFDVTSTVNPPTCSGDSNGDITISVSGGSPGYTYDWGLHGGDVSTINSLAPGSYFLVIEDAAGCDTLMNFEFDFLVDLQVTLDGTNSSCSGANDGSILANPVGSEGYNYSWNNGETTAFIDSLAPGTYQVTVTDTNGCTATANAAITEPLIAISSFTYNPSFLIVSFSNSSQGGTVLWDFGDGNTSSMWNTSHTYADAGTYTVCLTVFGACDTVTTCQDVTVEVNDASIDEEDLVGLSIYPNPATNELNVTTQQKDLKEIMILNVLGQVVKTTIIESEHTQVNLAGLTNGAYFCKVLANDGSTFTVRTFIINK